MELRERGWSIRAAAREVGVSRSTGTNWACGHKTYRNGLVVGFVAPLERLAVRQISAKFLSQDERIEIADLRHSGLSIRQIALKLGRAPSTISRELHATRAAGGAICLSRRIGWQRRDVAVSIGAGSRLTCSCVR
jgi:IS30 family transposase